MDIGTASSPVSSRGRLDTIVNKLNDTAEVMSVASESENYATKSVSTKAANNDCDYDSQKVDEAVKII